MVDVLCVTEDIERAKFFCRFVSLKKIFITTNLVVYIFLKFSGEKCWLINKLKSEKLENNLTNINNTIEVKTNCITLKEAHKEAESTYNLIDLLYKKYQFQYVFIWNGCKVVDVVCKEFAKNNNIKKCFFEIANIPGKIFVDHKGTNKQSSIFEHPELLDYTNVDNKGSYNEWLNNYLKIKKGNFILPQSKRKSRVVNIISSLINIFANKLNVTFTNNIYITNFKKNFELKNDNSLIGCDKVIKNKYIFVPLQVSNDTQVLINSDVGLYKLIDTALDNGKKDNLSVVIKPHPAEKNIKILEYIREKQHKYDVVITNANTFNLIENAEYVITINSTVGLEAMICGKKVIILGDAIYSGFNKARLRNYIMDFLIDIEYFSGAPLSEEAIESILRKSR